MTLYTISHRSQTSPQQGLVQDDGKPLTSSKKSEWTKACWLAEEIIFYSTYQHVKDNGNELQKWVPFSSVMAISEMGEKCCSRPDTPDYWQIPCHHGLPSWLCRVCLHWHSIPCIHQTESKEDSGTYCRNNIKASGAVIYIFLSIKWSYMLRMVAEEGCEGQGDHHAAVNLSCLLVICRTDCTQQVNSHPLSSGVFSVDCFCAQDDVWINADKKKAEMTQPWRHMRFLAALLPLQLLPLSKERPHTWSAKVKSQGSRLVWPKAKCLLAW